jgi:hypothetical protein
MMLQLATNWRPRPHILELLSSDALWEQDIRKRNAETLLCFGLVVVGYIFSCIDFFIAMSSLNVLVKRLENLDKTVPFICLAHCFPF